MSSYPETLTVKNRPWTRQQLLIAFALYCQLPFGQYHNKNPTVIRCANAISRTPAALAMKLCNIASLDPVFRASGRVGLKSVSTNDREMWDEMQSDWSKFTVESQDALDKTDCPEIISGTSYTIRPDLDDAQTERVGEDRFVHRKVRIGQQFFRQTVLSAYDNECCISGLDMPELLIASHIVPWSKSVKDRVNPRNGLLLSVLHDKAFDSGIITINEDLTVRVSRKPIPKNPFFDETIRCYEGKPIKSSDKFRPRPEFLAYHRERVFENW